MTTRYKWLHRFNFFIIIFLNNSFFNKLDCRKFVAEENEAGRIRQTTRHKSDINEWKEEL